MDAEIIKKLDIFFLKFPLSNYKKGETLIQAGTNPSGVFSIQTGIIKQSWISRDGSEVTLNLYKPHAFLPMSWAIGLVDNVYFYDALTPVTVRKAPKEEFLTFIHQEPDVTYDLLQRMYRGMEGLWMHIQSLTAGNSYVKLAASLVILGKRFGKLENGQVVVDLPMSEQDIASYAGMSRETTSRELQKLKKTHIVSFAKARITIQNMDLLEEAVLQ